MRSRPSRSTKQRWVAAMVEMLSHSINEARIQKVLRIIGEDRKPQGVMDV